MKLYMREVDVQVKGDLKRKGDFDIDSSPPPVTKADYKGILHLLRDLVGIRRLFILQQMKKQ
jgi:hypothetical protein